MDYADSRRLCSRVPLTVLVLVVQIVVDVGAVAVSVVADQPTSRCCWNLESRKYRATYAVCAEYGVSLGFLGSLHSVVDLASLDYYR